MVAMNDIARVLVVAVVPQLIPRSLGADGARAHVQAELADFGIRVDPPEVKAGQITFDVRNVSKTNTHELVVLATSLAPTRLPYQTKSDRVDESKLRSLGEVSDLHAGSSRRLTLVLKPGRYVLLCNEVGHYKAGTVTVFTVTRGS